VDEHHHDGDDRHRDEEQEVKAPGEGGRLGDGGGPDGVLGNGFQRFHQTG
jgi:hypothetical protein